MAETLTKTPTAAEVLAVRRVADRVLTDAAIEAWEKASDTYCAAAEALPATPENIGAKLEALRVIHGDDLDSIDEWLGMQQSGDARLVRQIIMTLVRAG